MTIANPKRPDNKTLQPTYDLIMQVRDEARSRDDDLRLWLLEQVENLKSDLLGAPTKSPVARTRRRTQVEPTASAPDFTADDLYTTAADARNYGTGDQRTYFMRSRPCPNGHVGVPHYANNGACVACTTIKNTGNRVLRPQGGRLPPPNAKHVSEFLDRATELSPDLGQRFNMDAIRAAFLAAHQNPDTDGQMGFRDLLTKHGVRSHDIPFDEEIMHHTLREPGKPFGAPKPNDRTAPAHLDKDASV